jgi:cytidylate kinase
MSPQRRNRCGSGIAADAQVVDFMTAAEGVTTIDSTDLDFEQTVQAVVDLVSATTS